jgi:hypothetical protein
MINLFTTYRRRSIGQINVNFTAGFQSKEQLRKLLLSKYSYVSPLLRNIGDGSTGRGIFYYNQTLGNISSYLSDKLKLEGSGGVKYSNTNVSKFLSPLDLNSFDMLFLRKSKIFNKGRYSRNRQFYRTGVYWCLYLSIILFTGLYYWFYHFIVNFGFFW